MKVKLLFFALTVILYSSCGTTSSTVTDTSNDNEINTITDLQPEVSLANYLRRFSGVMVKGSGPNVSIRIRSGSNSINMSSEPLFLVNGMQYGGDFSSLMGTIAVVDIKSVRVYKNASETAMYGVQGANGVIDIRLK